jgi:hypothetical protein
MTRVDFLRESQNSDGGWGYFPGRESRPEPTAYALRALGVEAKGIGYLLRLRCKDGGFAAGEGMSESTWVTQLVFPLLVKARAEKKILEPAAEWILRTEGAESGLKQRFLLALTNNVIEQDPRLRAWPWRAGNNSWVEPTAHGLLALEWMKDYAPEAGIRYRRDMAAKMMIDRRCADGGWNYGNKKVLGEVLPAYPETTGIALTGLSRAGIDVSGSVKVAEAMLARQTGAYGRAWLRIALQLHGISLLDAEEGLHPSRNVMLAALEAIAQKGAREAFLP